MKINQMVRQRFDDHLHCKEVSICKADECDKPHIAKFINDIFFKTEPASIICGVSTKKNVSKELLEIITDALDDNISYVVRTEHKIKQLAGVAINGLRPVRYESGHYDTLMERIKCKKEKDLLYFWSQISSLPREGKHFGTECRIVELEYLSVHPRYQRRGIAQRLLEQSVGEACRKGHKFLRMDCTSAYSAILGEKFGMTKIDEISFKDLRNREGKRYKNIHEPHVKAVVLIANLNK